MKKITLVMMLLFLSFTFYGCSILTTQENTPEYMQLSDQYSQYVTHDITNYDDFKDIMNEASNISTTSVFSLKTETLNIYNRVASSLYGSATLFFEDSGYIYLLTTFEVLETTSRKVNYYVTDAYGDTLSATIFSVNEELGLGILRASSSINEYHQVKFAEFVPLPDELMILISNSYPIQNIQRLGSYYTNDNLSYMRVKSSQNSNGSPIFNLALEVIGIQKAYDQTYVEIIDFKTITDYIGPLFSSL